MKKKFLIIYLLIFLVIIVVMSFSTSAVEKWRSTLIGTFYPVIDNRFKGTAEDELRRLEIENRLLKNKIADLIQNRNALPIPQAVTARVIFRGIDTWNSSLWIDKGSEDSPVVHKNSPVVVGKCIIGVIDFVSKHQARVRLITDSGLNPSVRVMRGEEPIYLAKGELRGSSGPLWRQRSQVLKGTGFNFDFPDDKGEARDLRTGQLVGKTNSSSISIIKVNDLLVTTGMDGVFPSGWEVATVMKIEPLKEGDYCYELEAQPAAGNLHDLSIVYVIPPIGFEPELQKSSVSLHK